MNDSTINDHTQSYAQHFREFAQGSEARVPGGDKMAPATRRMWGTAMSLIFPKGKKEEGSNKLY
jgi:hypothetical protein